MGREIVAETANKGPLDLRKRSSFSSFWQAAFSEYITSSYDGTGGWVVDLRQYPALVTVVASSPVIASSIAFQML